MPEFRLAIGAALALFVSIWLVVRVCRWLAQRATRRAEKEEVTIEVPGGSSRLSNATAAFADAWHRLDPNVRGPAMLTSDLGDAFCAAMTVGRDDLDAAMIRALGGKDKAKDLIDAIGHADRAQLTMLMAAIVAARQPLRVTRRRSAFRRSTAFITDDKEIRVKIGKGGGVTVLERAAVEQLQPAWCHGPRRWPVWPLQWRMRWTARRNSRGLYRLRTLLAYPDPSHAALLETSPLVAELVDALGIKALQDAATRRGAGTADLLRRCSGAQLAVLLCCGGRATFSRYSASLPVRFADGQ